jgi:hypothetical protein
VTPGDFLWVKHIVTWYDDETSTIVFCAKHGGSGGGGTIESITMNGSTLPIVSGVVDLGTVITAHQDISGKLNNDVAAEEFSTSGAYTVGEYVMHNGELYICKRDVMEQSWSTQDWTKVDIGTRLKTLNSIKPSIPLSFTSGHLTKFTSSGNLEDSGISANDVAEKPSTWTSGNLASLDNYGNPVDSGVNPEEKADCSTIGIVETGDTATHVINAGQYVIWKGSLYTADTAIAVNDTLASTGGSKNLTAVSGGIGAEVASLNSNISNKTLTQLGLTIDSTFDNAIGGYCRIGQFVMVQIRLNKAASYSFSSGSTLVSGFPTPLDTPVYMTPSANISNGETYIDTNGNLKNQNAISADRAIFVSGMYLAST